MAKKDKKKKPRHGGKRPGSGRPKASEPLVRKTVTVPKSLADWVESQGKTFSAAVVEALEAARS